MHPNEEMSSMSRVCQAGRSSAYRGSISKACFETDPHGVVCLEKLPFGLKWVLHFLNTLVRVPPFSDPFSLGPNFLRPLCFGPGKNKTKRPALVRRAEREGLVSVLFAQGAKLDQAAVGFSVGRLVVFLDGAEPALRFFGFILWMDKILHHFETIRNHYLLVFTGESLFQVFFRGAGFRPSTVAF